MVVMRQLTGAQEVPGHLQEAEAHQRRAQGDGAVDDPGRPFQVGRGGTFDEVGHVQAKRAPRGPHALGRKQHIDAAARAEVEHRFTGLQLRERGRIAAAK